MRAETTKRWVGLALRRALGAATVMFTVATLAFIALQFIPGDPAEAALGGPGSQASQEALEAARAEFGLDRPIPVQYVDFIFRLLRGDLGVSYAQRMPVAEVLGNALGPTLILTVSALVTAWVIALVSITIASGRSRIARAVTLVLDLTAAAIPNFWLASMLVLLFAGTLTLFPAVSNGRLDGIVLPTLALAMPIAGYLAQVCRAGIDDAKQAPFIESARARGETDLGVRLRHIVRHGLVPGLNLTAWALGSLLGGAAVIEVIFARPGLGRTLVTAVTARDVPVVLGVVLFAALAYVAVAFVTDLVIARIDPRTESRLAQAVPRA